MTVSFRPPVAGLDDLAVETRVIATPWSRIVRGIGLGQHPVGFDPTVARLVRSSFAMLVERVGPAESYTAFAAMLSEFVLEAAEAGGASPAGRLHGLLDSTMAAVRRIANPYSRATAATMVSSSIAKLGLAADPSIAARAGQALDEAVAAADEIAPDAIRDGNRGRHGDYERVAAWTAIFFALAQVDPPVRAAQIDSSRVVEALASIENIPAPFFRGRGGSMLLSAVALLDLPEPVGDEIARRLRSTLSWLDRSDELGLHPSFPSAMSSAFVEAYPLLTMLNAIAVSGRHEFLTFRRDRLRDAARLVAAMEPVERTHMGLYYVVALSNLGRLDDQLPELDGFVEPLVNEWRGIDPSRDYFLYGIAYAYLVQLACFTDRSDLVTHEMIERMVCAFPGLDATADGRAHRPYPFSYVLNVLGELGLGELLYSPHAAYGGRSPFAWVVDHLSPGGRAESARLYMLDHALVSWSLRMRRPAAPEPGAFGRFTFR